MEHNPYAPPTAASHAPAPRGFVFSSEGVEVVTSLAKWMRAMSTFLYVGMGLMVLGACGMAASGQGMFAAVAMLLFVTLIGMSATWLRSAASGFERGILGDDEMTLGQGFRSLRAYLILYGIFSIIGLISNVVEGASVL